METEHADRIALEDVEGLAQHHAARARRRRRDHVIAAIVALQRLELAGPVVGEVLARENAAMSLAGGHDLRRDRPLVEGRRTALRDGRERAREVGLNQPLARLPRL